MLRKTKLSYTYIFEQKDKQALRTWLKSNKMNLKDIYEELGVSYMHLKKIVTGKRTASPRIINTLRKKGVKFPKDLEK